MQKYSINKDIRVIELDECCLVYNCSLFTEYKLNTPAAKLIKKIILHKDIDPIFLSFCTQLNELGIITEEKE